MAAPGALFLCKAQPIGTPADQQSAVPTNAFGPLNAAISPVIHQQRHQKRLKQLFRCWYSCFGGSNAPDSQCPAPQHSVSSCSDSPTSTEYDVVPDLEPTYSASPRKSHHGNSARVFIGSGFRHKLSHCSSSVHSSYTDAEWQDAVSQFSGNFDQYQAGIEEVVHVVKELGSFMVSVPWIPNPPLAFGTPGMHFVPVPAITGFAAYWLRDDERTTPFPQPIDLMLKSSYVAKKVHESIPGILIQESASEIEIIANPGFMPKFLGINSYAEKYDKSNQVEHSWVPRRDLKMGRAFGKLYMTADGMLIARVWQKPAFSDKVDVIMEEYMRLEQGGEVIVDRMTCLHVESGNRASQYLVGSRRPGP